MDNQLLSASDEENDFDANEKNEIDEICSLLGINGNKPKPVEKLLSTIITDTISDVSEICDIQNLPILEMTEDGALLPLLNREDQAGTSNTGIENTDQVDVSQKGKKKRSSKGLADPKIWKQNINKSLRLEGEKYLGYRRIKINDSNKYKTKHDVPKEARKIGPKCVSPKCQKSKFRACSEINDEMRDKIFYNFWKMMDWVQRRQYVCSLVQSVPIKQKRSSNVESRRRESYEYFLITTDGKRLQVCQKMFLNTFGIKEWTVRYWTNKTDCGIVPKRSLSHKGPKEAYKADDIQFLTTFLDLLPKLPSHYCRRSSGRLYLEPAITTKMQLYNIYKSKCQESSKGAVSIWKFKHILIQQNISIYHPKKDQCDLCCAHKAGNLPDLEWKEHIDAKNRAREEKASDKLLAEAGKVHVFTQDVQAVKLSPFLQASSLYFKTKLCVHNFTMYNIGNREAFCYWFDETNGGLVASVFASCVVDVLRKLLRENPIPVILYSDGCSAQNRNFILSNALLELSMDMGVIITQKFLIKGHTQMECDSVHSAIESKLKNREIFLPSQYAGISKEVRPTQPYTVHFLDYTFFDDYACKDSIMFNSIRPGRKTADPTVTDIRVLQYDPSGKIKYKLKFEDPEFKDIPCRPKPRNTNQRPKLYKERIKIAESKWNHLQELKNVIPIDCHSYYDLIPH